jgi:hypothetical protein
MSPQWNHESFSTLKKLFKKKKKKKKKLGFPKQHYPTCPWRPLKGFLNLDLKPIWGKPTSHHHLLGTLPVNPISYLPVNPHLLPTSYPISYLPIALVVEGTKEGRKRAGGDTRGARRRRRVWQRSSRHRTSMPASVFIIVLDPDSFSFYEPLFLKK